MNFNPNQILTMAHSYLNATAGEMLGGMTHNANNCCHILEMQLELIKLSVTRAPSQPMGNIESKLVRFAQGTDKLNELLQANSQRSVYTQNKQIQFDPRQFFAWQQAFWTNNLFYKHCISLDLSIASDAGSIEVPAAAITFCLEEGLKNAVNHCKKIDPKGSHTLAVSVKKQNQGMQFNILSPGTLSENINPWEFMCSGDQTGIGFGLFLVKSLCTMLNWKTDLLSTPQGVLFSLSIDSLKSGPLKIETSV